MSSLGNRRRRGRRARKRQRAHYLLRRIVRFIAENQEWEVRFERIAGNPKLAKVHGHKDDIIGFVDDEPQRIYVDLRNEAIAIIVHEFLHVLYEAASEKRVQQMEDLVMAHMTGRQADTLFLAVSNLIRRHGD